jgi:hypothetical protein
LFNKKIDLPKLSYFILKVNLYAIEKWLLNQQKIKPVAEDKWKGFNTKEYKITILPTQPPTFFHNKVNEFSPSIGGLDIIKDGSIGCIEWSWTNSFFGLNVSEPRVSIFAAPIDEIFHLLKTGSNLSKQAGGDKGVIKIGLDEVGLFDEVYRVRSPDYSLVYSNELVSFTLVCANANDLVSY